MRLLARSCGTRSALERLKLSRKILFALVVFIAVILVALICVIPVVLEVAPSPVYSAARGHEVGIKLPVHALRARLFLLLGSGEAPRRGQQVKARGG